MFCVRLLGFPLDLVQCSEWCRWSSVLGFRSRLSKYVELNVRTAEDKPEERIVRRVRLEGGEFVNDLE